METSEAPTLVTMVAKVPDYVNRAIRNETLRRQLKGEKVDMKDVHREWLEEKAAQVGQAA
jgi:hypothetical protein